jgi:hypothetical protein
VIAALVAACSTSPTLSVSAPPPVANATPARSVEPSLDPAVLDGVWTGALEADQDYPVTLRLHGCVVGAACGENEYGVPGDPEAPQCAAELTLTDVTEAGFELAQRLTFQPWQCAPTTLLVRPQADGTIRVEEYGDRSAPPCCIGTLTRTSLEVVPSPLPLPGAIEGLGTPASVTWLGGGATQYPATTPGSLWLPVDGAGELVRIDTGTGEVLARIPVGDPSHSDLHSDPHAAAAADDGVWVTNAADRSLVLIDPATDAEVRRIALDVAPYALAIDGRRAWVAAFEDSAVVLVDLDAGKRVASTDVASPSGIAVSPGGDALWVVEHRADRVLRLQPDTLEVAATIDYGGPGPNDVCGYCIENLIYAEGAAWTADNHRRTVTRIDPRKDEATTYTLPLDAWSVAAGGGRIWASQYDPDAATSTWMTASIDPATGAIETYPLPAQSVAWADDILWAAEPARRSDILTGVAVDP